MALVISSVIVQQLKGARHSECGLKIMSINWNELRPWNGSQYTAFEELCCQLAEYEQVQQGTKFFRKGTPDAGVECYRVLSNGDEWGWQAKFFLHPPTPGEWQQIDDSVKTALEKHPHLTRYFVCLPVDRPDPRIPDQQSFMDRWNERVEKWRKWAHEKRMSVEFEYWGDHEISTRLSREEHRGRYFFWFNKECFSDKWFYDHIAETIADAGPRYTPELNVDLPIAHLFEGLGRTPQFFAKMQSLRGTLVKVHTKLQRARSTESARDAFDTLGRGIDRLRRLLLEAEEADTQQKDLKGLVDAAFESGSHVSDCHQVLENIEKAARDQAEKEITAAGNVPSEGRKRTEDFGYLTHHLYDLGKALVETTEFFGGKTAELANIGALLLVGEAGTGKTHLFCDVAKQRVESGMPTILLLGQHFSPSAEPWSQMTQLLGLACGKEEFLGALEAAAEARGGKALIMIDGLNEGEGRNIWHDHLPGILTAVRRFPRVAIALSLRSSYEDLIVPAELLNDKLVKETHHGFANHEYEATKTFFEYFGIERPAVPILHPEFQNPIFLKLFCQGLQNRHLTKIPAGLHGINSIFQFFVDSVNDKLSNPKILDYDKNCKPVQKAVAAFAKTLAREKTRWLPREEAQNLVNAFRPPTGYENSLFRHLLSEGVFSVDRFWEWDQNKREEGVRFSYDRLTDYSVAQILLDRHLDPINPEIPFAKGGTLGCFLEDEKTAWRYAGLIEAFSVLVPQRVGKEVAELAPYCADFEPVRRAFVMSLIFRDPKATGLATLKYVNEHVMRFRGTYEEFLDAFLTVASIPDHPFNADLLHKHLMKQGLADRDAWWSIYLHNQYGANGAVDRLVDWAWSSANKSHIKDESVRLTGVALTWFLTTSNRYLRDRATKALVALLTPRITVLRQVLRMFLKVNDPYVLERLCAVAYGCVMRSEEKTQVADLAKEVYGWFFDGGEPPPDILLRDYARGVIETALHWGVPLNIDVQKVRPPYKSEWPESIPTKEELEKFDERHDGMAEEERARLDIYTSVMGFGDFARYIIGTNSGSFEWSSRRLGEPPRPTKQEIVATFVKSLTKKQKAFWDSFMLAQQGLSSARFSQLLGRKESTQAKPNTQDLQGVLQIAERSLCRGLGKAKLKTFREIVAPILNNPASYDNADTFDLTLAQRWILNKVFGLGWTAKYFGLFDRDVNRYSHRGRGSTKPERIGKKYQWMAYHEFLARVSDNFEFKGESWSRKTEPFEGPWQFYARDIDPSCLLTKTKREEWQPHTNTWWFPSSYRAWDLETDDTKWIRSSTDLPVVEPLLEVESPEDHTKWLVMEAYYDWEQPTSPEEERFEVPRRSIWYMLKSYILKKDDTEVLFEWAAKQNLWGRWMPESHDLYRVFLGEFHWAPAYLYHNKPYYGQVGWTRGDHKDMPAEVLPTTNLYTHEGNGYDCSVDETMHIYLPCKWLVDLMQLHWNGAEGRYFNQEGQLLAMDPSVDDVGPGALLINKYRLLECLHQAGYDMFWTVLGEKDVVGGRDYPDEWKGRLIINGAFRFQDGKICGTTHTTFEAPK